MGTFSIKSIDKAYIIPSWVRLNAQRWGQGRRTYEEFLSDIQMMIKEGVVVTDIRVVNPNVKVKRTN